MFKFEDNTGSTIYLKPSCIESVEHSKAEANHTLMIGTVNGFYKYNPTSEEDCRKFLHELFTAMGETYKYE